jgi:hypothetical protein
VSTVEDVVDRGSRKSVASSRLVRSSTSREIESDDDLPESHASAQDVLATLQRSMGSASGATLGNKSSTITISTKALAGTLIGAAAGAAVAFAMCKSEEESAQAEERAVIMAADRRRFSVVEEPTPPRSRRGSLRRIEPMPEAEMRPVGTQTYMTGPSAAAAAAAAAAAVASVMSSNSRREAPPQYVSMASSSVPSRSPTVISARSARRPTAESVSSKPVSPVIVSRAASAYERASEAPTAPTARTSPSAAKSEAASSRHSRKSSSSSQRSRSKAVPERRNSLLQDIGEDEQLAASTVSRQSQKSRKSHSHAPSHVSSSRQSSAARRLIEESVTPQSSAEFLGSSGMKSSDDDRDTVVPSDSISCVGSAKSRRSTSSKHSSRSKDGESKSKTSSKHHGSHKYDRHDDLRSEPPIRKSSRKSAESEGSEATITPRNFKERSVMSLPLRGTVPTY